MRRYNRMTWKMQVSPREWQLQALERWRTHRRGVVSVVTGGGKTVFAQLCMQTVNAEHPQMHFVVVVPTLALLDQWYVSLVDDLGVSEREIACYSGASRPKHAARVNLAVLNTARNVAPRLAAQRETFLIVDECHRAGTPVNGKALAGRHAATLGLSATPAREYDTGFEQIIVPALGPIIFEYDYVAARRDGVITAFELRNVEVEMFPDERAEYDKLSQRIARLRRAGTDAHRDERLKRLLQQRAAVAATARMRIPVAARIAETHSGRGTIIFHERQHAADMLAAVLRQRGLSVAVYHSGISATRRRENLRLFRKGVYDCLVTCRALDEGMNVPETSIAVIASSTRSTRQRVQRLGRVLRPAPGKTEAVVYTIFATEPERRRLLAESATLGDITQTFWMRGGRRTDGESIGGQ